MKKKNVLAVAVVAGIACLAGCSSPTTGAEIDRIMAEARAQAADELAKSRGGWESDAAAMATTAGPTP